MNVTTIITNKIIEHFENGTIPWKKPWTGLPPQNFISKRPYSGINFFLLTMANFAQPYFLTFNQVNKLGGHIIKGQKSTMITFWGVYKVNKEEQNKDKIIGMPFLKYYRVFNVEQCEGLDVPELYKHDKDPKYEEILESYKDKPQIVNGQRASYEPKNDKISMPLLNSFKTVSGYYATLFHELIHSTGNSKRLNRFSKIDSNIFGSEIYSKEELIAELGSAFLCARYGIDNSLVENSAGYIKSWLKVLNNDPKLLISASSKAQRAVNYLNKDEQK